MASSRRRQPAGYRLPSTRPLRIYAFDPSAGRQLNNFMLLSVRHERLQPGPVGTQLAVIDYDGSNDVFYEPVDLDHPAVLLGNGLQPSESDPRFHQQMVYAVASETIRRFEFALGRQIRWRTRPGSRKTDPLHRQLRIFPHAFQQANAFYDPQLRALLFGYFAASEDDAGEALPGQTVFTCLSHDIVAHETTHALVDGQREFLTEPTGADTAAFHEAFADIVALFQHFSYKDALLDTINRTGGMIYRKDMGSVVPQAGDQAAIIPEMSDENPLVGLARQFGQAIGQRAALRSAIGTPPNSTAILTTFEPHDRGAILVSAIFDAFFTIYIKRTRDLMRIGRSGGAIGSAGDLHPDLAARLAGEAAKTAEHFTNICIRALDYCPPIDIRFGEFLRAMITADSDLVPDDPLGYRAELIKAFRLRGIIPEDVSSYSEEALRWCGPETDGTVVGRCGGLEYDIVRDQDDDDDVVVARNRKNAAILNAFAKAQAEALGLDAERGIQVHSYHPVHRISPEGRLAVDFVVELMQQREEKLDPKDPASADMVFRGGATVILNHRGEVRYVIRKSINNAARLEAQREYQSSAIAMAAYSPYVPDPKVERLNFQAVHRGC